MEFGYIAAGKKIIAINDMNNMKVLNYRILLRKEPEGGYTVMVPLLPGCVSCGETIEEAIDMAKEAVELYIESLKEHGLSYT
jgi:predicted RNase H-like HicB family nuclease